MTLCEDNGNSFIGNLYNSTMLLKCQKECLPDCEYIIYSHDIQVSKISEEVIFSEKW